MTVTKDMTIAEIISKDPNVIDVLLGAGMHCIGCFASANETLEQAAYVHGLDAEELVREINSREG